MTTSKIEASSRSAHIHPYAPDLYERFLAFGAMILLVMVAIALFRGFDTWHKVSPFIWAHLGTIIVALALTPILLLSKRGNKRHRQLGWAWAILMFGSAFISFWIRSTQHGGFSFIHILSVAVVITVPLIVLAARRHKVDKHRTHVRALVTGGLLTAGFFTFPFNRLLGQWLFG